MKYFEIITVLTVATALLAGICLAADPDPEEFKYPFTKCPTPKLPKLKPIPLNKYLGTWFALRGTPCDHGPKMDVDCVSDTYWMESSNDTTATEANKSSVVNLLFHQRINGSIQFHHGGSANVTHLGDGLVDNLWTINLFGFSMPSMVVETDEGHSYAIFHSCSDMGDGKTEPTPIWFIMSRTRTMDAKLEQSLVQKITTYSGITSDKLEGWAQTDCY